MARTGVVPIIIILLCERPIPSMTFMDVKLLEKSEMKRNLWTVVEPTSFLYFLCCCCCCGPFSFDCCTFFRFGRHWINSQWEIQKGITTENADDFSDILSIENISLIWSFWSELFIMYVDIYFNSIMSMEYILNGPHWNSFSFLFHSLKCEHHS